MGKGQKAQDEGENGGQKQVAHRAGEGDDTGVAPGVGQIVGVEDNRLAPAKTEEQEHDGADGVEVGQGIKGQAALGAGGGITEAVSDQGVGKFVDGDGDDEAKEKIKCFHHGQSIQDVVECLPKMLACETYPRVPKKYPDLDGGHHKVGFSFGDMEFAGSDLLGSYHRERGVGFESCVVRKGLGELIEVSVDDREVRVDYDNRISAIYDRKLGVLNCASFSLAREMKKLSRAGSDIIVVVNFDDDGSERVF